jgi:hypothetical protein
MADNIPISVGIAQCDLSLEEARQLVAILEAEDLDLDSDLFHLLVILSAAVMPKPKN